MTTATANKTTRVYIARDADPNRMFRYVMFTAPPTKAKDGVWTGNHDFVCLPEKIAARMVGRTMTPGEGPIRITFSHAMKARKAS